MIPPGDPDMTAHLNELLRTNKPKTRLSGSQHLKILESLKITPQYRNGSSKNFSNSKTKKDSNRKRAQSLETNFSNDSTDTLLTELEKQAIEDILVDYHDILARHKMDIGTNTEFKVKLTPKDNRAVYSQSLPMPIHLKVDLIVELGLTHKYGIITVLPFSKYASPIIGQRQPNGNFHPFVDLRQMTILILFIQ